MIVRRTRRRGAWWAGLWGALLVGLSACTGATGEGEYREFGNPDVKAVAPANGPSLKIFGLGGNSQGGASGVGVNTFLWRASLDTVSFLPLVSADPFGGVIITDWYSPPDTPFERFKLIVYILDNKLRVDGVKVNVFRQQLVDDKEWKDAAVHGRTGTSVENAILTRARQMRIKALSE